MGARRRSTDGWRSRVGHALLAVVLCATATLAYERLQGPTELLFHDEAKAFNGFTLFGVGGRTVWEYTETRDGAVKVIGDVLPMTNSLFRAFRYGPDHPALRGRDPEPKGTITERAAQGLDPRPGRGGPRKRRPEE